MVFLLLLADRFGLCFITIIHIIVKNIFFHQWGGQKVHREFRTRLVKGLKEQANSFHVWKATLQTAGE